MDCFNNTCLSCDRECEDKFCSPSCKLADQERGTNSATSNSATPPTTPGRPSIWHSSTTSPGYVLEPAIKFPSGGARQSQASYFMWNPSMGSSQRPSAPERSLTPSSSRSSLSSTTSVSHGISAQDTQQLEEYFSSFEKVRAAKRRSSLR